MYNQLLYINYLIKYVATKMLSSIKYQYFMHRGIDQYTVVIKNTFNNN